MLFSSFFASNQFFVVVEKLSLKILLQLLLFHPDAAFVPESINDNYHLAKHYGDLYSHCYCYFVECRPVRFDEQVKIYSGHNSH